MIHHSRPCIGRPELAAVGKVLRSRHLAQGPEVEKLERRLPAMIGHRHGVAVSSGTAALYLALRGLDVGRGDRVVIPSYVCTALLNAVNMTGATPVLSDVCPENGNMRAEDVKAVLTRRAKAVIVPHLFGYPADVEAIARLGVPVVEDCAQCVGAAIGGKPVGGLSLISVFSFFATKLLCAGEGGLVATSDRKIAQRVRDLREYDKRSTYTPAFNFKLSDVHAALACTQVGKLSAMIGKRRGIARQYTRLLEGLPGAKTPTCRPDVKPAWYRYVIRVSTPVRSISRKMREAGIECGKPIFRPLHRFINREGFPGTERIHHQAISLPIYPDLTHGETTRVVRALQRAMEQR